jgi:NAD(P)-dependent dehydrogenase (short-subunit alcohol dehydrogenase family)
MSTTAARITSRFEWASTAMEVIEGLDLAGTRAVITGAASGIGVETARALASAGGEVVIAARSVAAADRVAEDIRATIRRGSVRTAQLDLLSRDSIDRFAASFTGPLHLLIDNAGIMAVPDRQTSPEGHELQFATNHLGHFRLATALLPAMRAASGARVVSVSSRAHLASPVVFEDIDFKRRSYDPASAYAQSKTANVLFAVAATNRWADDGIVANALHPGAMIDSNLMRYSAPEEIEAARFSGKWLFKTRQQGAATSVFVATSPLLAQIGGRYFENSQQAVVDDPTACGLDAAGVAPHALDPEAADRLWKWSEQTMA